MRGIPGALAALLQTFELLLKPLKFMDALRHQRDMRRQQAIGFSTTGTGGVFQPQ